ncbi:MAG: hypothetical protein JWQ37_2540, partial [Blastococcus sp.]|nr:hypothetical protein [Blastococcus sp.]
MRFAGLPFRAAAVFFAGVSPVAVIFFA